MPDLSPLLPGSKCFLATITMPRQRADRPPLCARCQSLSWWNGWRTVFPMVPGVSAGTVERWELPLARAKCSRCKHRFTCYPPNSHPHRQYQLDVVAEAVAEVAFAGRALAEVARAIHDAPPGAGASAMVGLVPARRRAAQVLAALEHLGLALLRRGVSLAERTGLGRVLGWQRQLHGDVYRLVAGVRTLDCPAMVHVESSGGL